QLRITGIVPAVADVDRHDLKLPSQRGNLVQNLGQQQAVDDVTGDLDRLDMRAGLVGSSGRGSKWLSHRGRSFCSNGWGINLSSVAASRAVKRDRRSCACENRPLPKNGCGLQFGSDG